MALTLQDRVAVVIGGARGIGEGIVDVLVESGARVVLADVREDLAAQVAARHDGRVTATKADISNAADMKRVVDETVARHGRLDILCQVAGIYPARPLEDVPEEEWDRVLNINLKGAFLAMKAAVPVMKRQKYGRIVLTGSITGPIVSWPEHAAYASSKAGLVGLAKTAAIECGPFGITVNVMAPGNVETPNLREERGAEHMAMMARAVPSGRLATPRDCGNCVAFLASDAASYVNGTVLVLDGGQVLLEAKL
ncbi:MAG: SDR family NAD(P)-dependent oxidoreductase [Devosia sp.]